MSPDRRQRAGNTDDTHHQNTDTVNTDFYAGLVFHSLLSLRYKSPGKTDSERSRFSQDRFLRSVPLQDGSPETVFPENFSSGYMQVMIFFPRVFPLYLFCGVRIRNTITSAMAASTSM